jgi:hypothetical protein
MKRESTTELEPPQAKRTRVETLCRDISLHLHQVLGAYHLLDVCALLAWHQTCVHYYTKWCDPIYLTELLQHALRLAQRLQSKEPISARHTARVVTLDCCLLSVRLGEAMIPFCGLGDLRCLDFNCLITTRYLVEGLKVRNVLKSMNDARILALTDSKLPARARTAFHSAIKYVRVRYGWCVTLERLVTRGSGVGEKTEICNVGAGDEVELDDALVIQLAPETYK